MRVRFLGVAAGAAVLGSSLLTGCGTDLAGFADRADAACAKAGRTIDRLAITGDTSAGTATAALRTALDRYKVIELLISELTESARPGGADGRAIEDNWLDPARRSLAERQSDLLALSHAVRDGDDARVPELADLASRAGVDGVDAGYLGDNGMPACAALFA